MTESAALLADEVLPRKPLRQWVLSLPFALHFLLATDPRALTRVLGIVYRTITAHILRKARLTRTTGATGAVTLIQRFGSALNLNIHFHRLALDGAYLAGIGEPVEVGMCGSGGGAQCEEACGAHQVTGRRGHVGMISRKSPHMRCFVAAAHWNSLYVQGCPVCSGVPEVG